MADFEFHLHKDNWEEYVERIELYCIANKITDDSMQVATLLTKCGADTYKLIRELCAPSKPKEKTINEIVKLMTDHLNPKKNTAMERCIFSQAKQNTDESVNDFIARLKELAMSCNFTDLDEALCNQLVCGIRDHNTKIALFSEKDLTYKKAVEIATNREVAVRNAANTEKQTVHSSVQHVTSQRFQRKGGPPDRNNYSKLQQGDNRGNYTRRNNGNNFETNNFNSNARTVNTRNFEKICFCCGMKNNHNTRDCRFRNYSCNFCKTVGHLEKACIKKHGKNHLFINSNNEKQFDNKCHLMEPEQQDANKERDKFYSTSAENKLSNCNKIIAQP